MMAWFDSRDVLETKKRELEAATQQYESAVSLVTSTVKKLNDLGTDIAAKIEEIDRYQQDLTATREDLCRMKEKNDKVAANFSALLGED